MISYKTKIFTPFFENVSRFCRRIIRNVLRLKNRVYIQKIKNMNGYDVWLVDGSYVRKNINENFVEYDHHLNHNFVPKNELWIDTETNPEERKFFIDHMFMEINFVKTGKDIKDAVRKADVLEKQEREAELKKRERRGCIN